jgi:hypothetical protein
MSFLDGLKSFGSSALGSIAQIAVLAFVSKQMSNNTPANNVSTDTTANIDAGVRVQEKPNSTAKIPVLYGTAFFGGNITDAEMTADNKTMYYVITLSERTGTKLSDGQASAYLFKDVYWNDQRIIFKTDGITINYTVDRQGTQDISLRDQVKIYCYRGGSNLPTVPENYTNASLSNADVIMPSWESATHTMNELIFAVVRVDYSREKNVTGIGDLKFHIQNSMFLPGDVLYDYMTNTRYGAGIAPAEILSA